MLIKPGSWGEKYYLEARHPGTHSYSLIDMAYSRQALEQTKACVIGPLLPRRVQNTPLTPAAPYNIW